MMGLTFIQPNLRTSLHVSIKQPVDDEECPFDPSYFTRGDGKIMLIWMGGKLSQKLTGRHDTGYHGCRTAQDIRPVSYNRAFPDFATNLPLQLLWDTTRIKDIQTF